ncbi:unannotated protein [freshwater metagenome]|uniref:Unannotated protein n=1 Tax=freshwater metagenome TaxID=449393 RepID=A0A6J6UX12_9ZZZZ
MSSTGHLLVVGGGTGSNPVGTANNSLSFCRENFIASEQIPQSSAIVAVIDSRSNRGNGIARHSA